MIYMLFFRVKVFMILLLVMNILDLLMNVKAVKYDSLVWQDSILTEEDKEILQAVIEKLGSKSKDSIVQYMHKERAYIETAPRDIIQYKYALELSLD